MRRLYLKIDIWMASSTSGLTDILTILRKIALHHGVHDKTNKYKLTQKGNKISDQIVYYPECETRILIKLLLSMTYIFIVFCLMWVSPLVHNAIHIHPINTIHEPTLLSRFVPTAPTLKQECSLHLWPTLTKYILIAFYLLVAQING